MKPAYLRFSIPAAALFAATAPAFAQVQYQPVGIQPATQASVANLDNRLVALEQQLAQFLRQAEENAHRIGQLESELRQAREEQNRRLAGLEERIAGAAAAAPVQDAAPT